MSLCRGKLYSKIKGDGALCWQLTFKWFIKKVLCAILAKQKLITGPHSVKSNCRSVATEKDKARKL